VTSSVTTVTVTPDTVRPTVTLVSVGANRTTLTLRFSEAVLDAGNTAHYSISPNVGVLSATVAADNRTVTLETGPRTFRTSHTLNVSGIQDTAVTPNTITATNITFEQDSMIIAGFLDEWKYELGNQDGAAWTNANPLVYDDSLWSTGNGLFGTETSAGITNMLWARGLFIQTPWAVSATQPTYYVRKRVNVTIPTDDIVFEMHHYIDDGAVAYVNGPEAWRLAFTNGEPVSFSTFSGDAPAAAEASLLTNSIPLVAGDNLIAVEVHQTSDTSTDVVFGAEIVAVHRIVGPRLTIVQSGANATVSWTPAVGTLQQSTDLVNWINSPNQANGAARPASTGSLFFRVLR
jgi:hypothetical protein